MSGERQITGRNIFMVEPQIPEFSISLKNKQPLKSLAKVTTPKEAADIARTCFDADTFEWVESIIIIALSGDSRVLGFYKVAKGTTDSVSVDNKVILQFALLSNASGLIIVHNHPSGSPDPSTNDKLLTRKLSKACDLLNIRLVDHIILASDNRFFSMGESGMV